MVASGFLLGTVSGSGVATTVTVGSIAWPLLRRAGYPPAVAGGLFSAAGIGATLSPPTLGAAAIEVHGALDERNERDGGEGMMRFGDTEEFGCEGCQDRQ